MIWFGRRPCRCWLWEPNRLAEHGTGWQHELDAARRRHARVLLTDPDLTQRSIMRPPRLQRHPFSAPGTGTLVDRELIRGGPHRKTTRTNIVNSRAASEKTTAYLAEGSPL